jgi:hypothetical protein
LLWQNATFGRSGTRHLGISARLGSEKQAFARER